MPRLPDIEREPTEQEVIEQLATEGAAILAADEAAGPGRFTKPGPRTDREALMHDLFAEREDDPPPDVPRDQWERPIIVTPDGGLKSYIRASSYGCIEDKYGISMWKRYMVVFGLSRAFHLVQRAQSARSVTDKADRAILIEVADRAEIVAGSDAGSLTGTALHKLSERRDEGADLAYLDPVTAACLDAYGRLMAPFEVLATELFVVCDDYGGAGTLDRVVRLRWDLRFANGIVIPAGTILVIDVKTGKLSSVKYWMAEYCCQQFIYDSGRPYRPGITHLADPKKRSIGNITRVTDQPGDNGRLDWADVGAAEPNHDYALILHVPATQPDKARIVLVNLTAARADADVCRQAWRRRRVPWAERFEALPADQLVPPGELADGVYNDGIRAEDYDASKINALEVDAETSTPADPPPTSTRDDTARDDQVNPTLVAALLERLARTATPADVELIVNAWQGSPSWTAEVHNAAVDRWDALTAVGDANGATCALCTVTIPYADTHCGPCSLRLALTEAPDRAAINVLWIAHGPDGDGLWSEEHQAVGIDRYMALPATDEWPDLNAGDDEPPAPEPAEPEAAREESEPGPLIRGPLERLAALTAASDEGLRLMREEGMTAEQAAAALGYEPEQPAEPDAFDQTMDLAALRDALREALDPATVDELYDRYGPQAGGPWDDECTALGQAVYDRVSVGAEA